MDINAPRDGEISIDDGKEFVEKQDVGPDQPQVAAYTLVGPKDHLIGVRAGTNVAPDFRDANGDPIDGSSRITIQKCDRQGNLIGTGVVFTELYSKFNTEKMRNDDRYFRNTQEDLMIDEKEIVKVLVDIPKTASGFSAAASTLTIGDETSDFGQPVEIVNKKELRPEQQAAVNQASQGGA